MGDRDLLQQLAQDGHLEAPEWIGLVGSDAETIAVLRLHVYNRRMLA